MLSDNIALRRHERGGDLRDTGGGDNDVINAYSVKAVVILIVVKIKAELNRPALSWE